MAGPRVLVLLGSKHDQDVAMKAAGVLRDLGVPHDLHVASAHQTPERLVQIVKDSPAKVILTVAQAAAGLSGAVASLTMRPVIGVPVMGTGIHDPLGGVQMPSGVAVATVGVDQGENAALLAASILGLSDEAVQRALAGYREAQREKVTAEDADLQSEMGMT